VIHGSAFKFQKLYCPAIIAVALIFSFSASAQTAPRQVLHGHVPGVVALLSPTGILPGARQLNLAIGLPLRNPAELDELLRELYDPASPNFRKFLTPEEFTARFGPTESDYAAVRDFVRTNGLVVTGTYGNRLLLDVAGPVTAVESAFNVTLRTYRHPTENRDFFAPDTEPTVDAALPMVDIQGLSDYSRPHTKLHRMAGTPAPRAGSAPGSTYMGNDFRAAYVPGSSLNGSGQMVGLVQFDGYYASDITAYEGLAGRTNIPLQVVKIDGFNGVPTTGSSSGNPEVSLDIEMVMSMAPALAKIILFEGNPNGTSFIPNDVLNTMAASNTVKNLSSSWGWSAGPGATTDNIFITMMAQGQSFFNASGDSDAFPPGFVDNSANATTPSSSPYITQCGATTLTMNGTGTSYASETVWNWGYDSSASAYVGSSGGVSTYYPIPIWQQGINSFQNNGGSTTMRNIPDVAMVGDNVYVDYGNGSSGAFGGTSCAAPLWAGFMALANQQAAAGGKTSGIGFINPVVYEIANESIYNSAFNDITTGNNTWPSSPNAFYAVPGYDLCTGVGTPAGTNLINALVNPDTLIVVSNVGFNAIGSPGAVFSLTSQIFYLTNVGASTLNWSLVNTSSWLNASTGGGTLAAGASSPVVVSLNIGVASNLNAGTYSASLGFSNVSSGVTHYRFFTLTMTNDLVQNSGFETGDFTDWTLTGDGYPDDYVTNSVSVNTGSRRRPNIVTINPHSGGYFAVFGETNGLAQLSQSLPTAIGQKYLLSLWLDNPMTGSSTNPNEFSVSWNGSTLYDKQNIAAFGWSNMQFVVTSTGGGTVLQIGGRDDHLYLGLDDVTVTPVFAPSISMQPTSPVILSGRNAIFSAAAGGSSPLIYQWRKNGVNISNGAGISGATSNTLTLTAVTTSSSGNYSLIVTNIFGAATSSVAALTVVLPPSITGSTLANQTVQCGSNNITFAITASGTLPLGIQWSLDGVPVANATNTSFSLANLHLPNHAVGVVVTNLYGSVTNSAVVTVHDTIPPVVALIGSNPLFVELGSAFNDPGATATDLCAGVIGVIASGTVNTNSTGTNTVTYTANDGDGNIATAMRTIIVQDTTPPTILWSFTNLVLAADTNCSAAMPDVTGTNYILATDLSGALTISEAPTNNSILQLGTNTIVIIVADASGNTSYSTNTIVVVDETPPVILTQPQSQTNTVGTTVYFNVAATACTPLAYEWVFNDTVLTNETNSTLEIDSVSTNDAGNYSVVATASGGSVTSAVVTLTVDLPPPAFNGVAVVPDGSFNLSLTGTPGQTYVLEVKADLSPSTVWLPIATNTLGADGGWQFNDGQATNCQQRFYRIRQLP
jgi:hypothetical protein